MILWQFVSMILTPVISLAGIVGNVLVIVVIRNEKNQKNLKEKQYVYMKLKSATNCLILFVQLFNLLTSCQVNNGIFCSSVHKIVAVQYLKIVGLEFLNNYLRFLSNMFHIAFSINRISLIEQKNSKFTEYMSKLSEIKYIVFNLIIGFLITFVKAFRLRANFDDFRLNYPFVYSESEKREKGVVLQLIISICNCACDLVNGIVFVMFSLVIDVQLVGVLKKTVKERLAKLKSMSQNQTSQESAKADMKELILRTVRMVELNSLVNLLLKMPSTITSTIELIRFVYGYKIHFQLMSLSVSIDIPKIATQFVKCEYLNLCQALSEFANVLFLISVSIDILFYYNFDKKFNSAFFNVFS